MSTREHTIWNQNLPSIIRAPRLRATLPVLLPATRFSRCRCSRRLLQRDPAQGLRCRISRLRTRASPIALRTSRISAAARTCLHRRPPLPQRLLQPRRRCMMRNLSHPCRRHLHPFQQRVRSHHSTPTTNHTPGIVAFPHNSCLRRRR